MLDYPNMAACADRVIIEYKMHQSVPLLAVDRFVKPRTFKQMYAMVGTLHTL